MLDFFDTKTLMSTIRVAIDTSIFRSESLSAGPMEALARFAEQKHIEIFIPYVVAEEYRCYEAR